MHTLGFHCVRLVVESRNPHNGYWDREAVFKPEYVYEEEIVRHWYWWTKTIRDIANQYIAHSAARVAAIKKAKSLCGEVRVTEYWYSDTFYSAPEVIWRDGKFLDG